jgi:hypothetical protein
MFWVISTALVPGGNHCGTGTNKNRQYGFSIFLESAKANLVLKCLELKFRFAFVLQNSFALVFKEMDHCCVFVVLLQI